MEFEEPTPEKKNLYLEKIKEFFGDDFELIENPEPEELFDLVFSTIKSKEVHTSGEARMEETIYVVTDDEDISELKIHKDYTSRESELEGWEGFRQPFGGELVIDGLAQIPIDKKIVYLIKQQEIPSEMEGPIPDFVPDELREKLERSGDKSKWLDELKKISEMKKQRDKLTHSDKELDKQLRELEQIARSNGVGFLLESEWISIYRFDKTKIYSYIKEHDNDEAVQRALDESANAGKCKYWLSED